MKVFILPEDLRNDILGYLVSRPYAEVAKGIERLEALAEVPPIAPAAPTLTKLEAVAALMGDGGPK